MAITKQIIKELLSGRSVLQIERKLKRYNEISKNTNIMDILSTNSIDFKNISFKRKIIKIIPIMGRSATGKSTLIYDLVNQYPDDYHMVKSYSTRQPRDEFDKETHIFVSPQYRDTVKDKIITEYKSDKGYSNWVDESCFHPVKINLYAIDSIAYNKEFHPYCKKRGWDTKPIYLEIHRDLRLCRFVKRGGKVEDFEEEDHLSSDHLSMKFKEIDVTGLKRYQVVKEFINKTKFKIK